MRPTSRKRGEKWGTLVSSCAEEIKILLHDVRGFDPFKKAFEVGGANSHF